jgi:hypothetical protein
MADTDKSRKQIAALVVGLITTLTIVFGLLLLAGGAQAADTSPKGASGVDLHATPNPHPVLRLHISPTAYVVAVSIANAF